MSDIEQTRVALRREAYDLKEKLYEFSIKLHDFDATAAGAVARGQLAAFEAWTILCTPPDDDDDEH